MATIRFNVPHNRNKLVEPMTFAQFRENLKKQWSQKQEVSDSHRAVGQAIPKVLLALQCPSQLYLFLYHIIPRLFEDYDEMMQTFLKLFVCFCCFEGLLNYFLTVFSDSSVKPNISKARELEIQHMDTNGHVPNGITMPRDDGELPWKFCDKCNMHIPPRAHHCKVCKKCILKRDHHCFMVGNCIGFYNQRYFFVLGFYAILCGLLAFAFNAYYLYLFYWPTAYSWTSFFPPITLFRWYLGYEDIETHVLILIFQLYPQFFFGGFGFIVINAQMTMCVLGKTAHEFSSKLPIKISNSIAENFESVFGQCWILNFVFPMTLCCRQTGDGTRWPGVKMEHTGNEKDHVLVDL